MTTQANSDQWSPVTPETQAIRDRYSEIRNTLPIDEDKLAQLQHACRHPTAKRHQVIISGRPSTIVVCEDCGFRSSPGSDY